IVSGPVSITDPSNLGSTGTFTGTGTATLRLTVTNPPCSPKTDDVVLTVNALPTANAGADQAKCYASATTSFTLAGVATNGTAAWSIVSGPVSIAAPSALNTGVTFTGTGTATLRLTVTSNANPPCPPATSDVVLSVTATTVTLDRSASPGCNGVLVYTANVAGGSGCAFDWTIDGQAPGTFAA